MVESKLDMSTGSTGKAEEKRLTGLLVKALIKRWKIDDDLANRILNDASLDKKGQYYDRVAIIKGYIDPEKVTKAQLELLQKSPSNSKKGNPDYQNISNTLTYEGLIPEIDDLIQQLKVQYEETPKQIEAQIEAQRRQAEKDKTQKAEEKKQKEEEKKQKEEAKIKQKVSKLDQAQEKQRISEENARIAEAKKQAQIQEKQKIAEAEETLKKSEQKALIDKAKKQAEIEEKQKIQQETEQAVQIQETKQTIALPEEIKESEFTPSESIFQQSMVQSLIPRNQPLEGRIFGRLQRDPDRISGKQSSRMSIFDSDQFQSAKGSVMNVGDNNEVQEFNQQLQKFKEIEAQQQIELKPVQDVKPKTSFFGASGSSLLSGFQQIGSYIGEFGVESSRLALKAGYEQYKQKFPTKIVKEVVNDPIEESKVEVVDRERDMLEQIDTTLNIDNKQDMEQSEVANVTQMIKNANSSKSSSSSKSSNKSKLEESALMQTFIEADLMRQPKFIKEGVLYIMGFGNLEQKKKLADELKNLDQMTDMEKTAFDKKMKKFSNVSKLADNVDKMKLQLLLDNRRQILEQQLVKKTKPKGN